jgi:hypothetical protein
MKNNGQNLVDHIRIEYDPRIKGLLFTERRSDNYDLFLNGKKVATQHLSGMFKEFLESKGFKLERSNKIKLYTRKSIAGVPISIQKNFDENKILREIIISVPARSEVEMVENRKAILEWLEKFCPDIKIEASISEKYVRC